MESSVRGPLRQGTVPGRIGGFSDEAGERVPAGPGIPGSARSMPLVHSSERETPSIKC
jgi:hypothetical protein